MLRKETGGLEPIPKLLPGGGKNESRKINEKWTRADPFHYI
jgi:hypothetical protein